MKVIDRHYECVHFKYEGDFDPKRKIVTAPKLGLRIIKINPVVIEVLYGLYSNAAYGAILEFDLKALITIDLENKKADAEQFAYLVLDAAHNAYKCLRLELNEIKKNVFPPEPQFNKTEILGLVQHEISDLRL